MSNSFSLFRLHSGAFISRPSLSWVVWYQSSVQVCSGSKRVFCACHWLHSGSAEHGHADSSHKPAGTTLQTFVPDGSISWGRIPYLVQYQLLSYREELLNLTAGDCLWICNVSGRTVRHPWCSLASDNVLNWESSTVRTMHQSAEHASLIFSSPANVASLYSDSFMDNILLNGRLVRGKLIWYCARSKSIMPSLSWSVPVQCLMHERTEWCNFCWNWLISESSR